MKSCDALRTSAMAVEWCRAAVTLECDVAQQNARHNYLDGNTKHRFSFAHIAAVGDVQVHLCQFGWR